MLNRTVLIVSLLLSILAISLVFYFSSGKKKIAYVEVQVVFNKFNMKKDLQKKYETETLGRKSYLDSLAFVLQSEKKVLENTAKPLQERIDNFLRLKEEYLTKLELFNSEKVGISKKYDEQIFKQMNQYVEDFGKENKYDYVFGTDGNGNLMYADQKENITDQVIEYINKKYEGK